MNNSTLLDCHIAITVTIKFYYNFISERLLKLQDYYEGSFQDFTGHSDALNVVCFSPSGKLAVTVAHSEMIMWQLVV